MRTALAATLAFVASSAVTVTDHGTHFNLAQALAKVGAATDADSASAAWPTVEDTLSELQEQIQALNTFKDTFTQRLGEIDAAVSDAENLANTVSIDASEAM